MIRRPPRSTLFPTRRSSDLAPLESINGTATGISGKVTFDPDNPGAIKGKIVVQSSSLHVGNPRSEEHTSELQSQSNLVCRLLLEKKKQKQHKFIRHEALRA